MNRENDRHTDTSEKFTFATALAGGHIWFLNFIISLVKFQWDAYRPLQWPSPWGEGGYLPRGCLHRGCLPGGCLPEGCLSGGVSSQWGCRPGGLSKGVCPGVSGRHHHPLWTEFLTHACENFTFPQTYV